MRNTMIVTAALLALVACGEPTPPPAVGDAAAPAAPVASAGSDDAPAPVDCTQLSAVFAAFDEPSPFASLEVGPPIRLLDAACSVNEQKAAGAPATRTLACPVFAANAPDRATSAAAARAAFAEAHRQVSTCLPADWTMREGIAAPAEADEAMIYESRADAARAMTATSYVYPVQLKKAWSAGVGGEPSAWRVTLDFQKETGGR
jgi:hypothetical protein